MAQILELDPAPYRKEALDRARALVAAFPSVGGAHATFAAALADSGAPGLEVLTSYKRCIELDPQNGQCCDAYDRFAAAVTSPRCTGASVRSELKFYAAAQAEAGRTGPSVEANGERLVLEDLTLLRAGDVQTISSSPTWTTCFATS